MIILQRIHLILLHHREISWFSFWPGQGFNPLCYVHWFLTIRWSPVCEQTPRPRESQGRGPPPCRGRRCPRIFLAYWPLARINLASDNTYIDFIKESASLHYTIHTLNTHGICNSSILLLMSRKRDTYWDGSYSGKVPASVCPLTSYCWAASYWSVWTLKGSGLVGKVNSYMLNSGSECVSLLSGTCCFPLRT